MTETQMKDLTKAVETITKQMTDKSFGEVTCKIQDGRIVMIESTVKVKP